MTLTPASASIRARIADRPSDEAGEPNVPSRWGKFGLVARQDCAPFSRYTVITNVTESSDGSDPDSYGVQGRTVHGAARLLQCLQPPPLTPVGKAGDLELTLYGDQSIVEPGDCVSFPVG